MSSKGRRRRHTIDECVDFRNGLVMFILESGIIIQDRHGRRSSGALNMLDQGVWIFENRGGKEDRLFAKSWVIITNYGLCEHFMCCAAGSTPTRSKRVSFEVL